MEQTLDAATDFDPFDRDIQLKRAIDVLKKENRELRQLVVRLSETILRNVTADASRPSMFLSATASNETTSRTDGAIAPPLR